MSVMKKAWFLLALALAALSCKPLPIPAVPASRSAGAGDRDDLADARAVNGDFVRMARYAMPAVVHLYALRENANPSPTLIALLRSRTPLLKAVEAWVRGFSMTSYATVGTGSGFLISKRGYILTNNHVVAEGDRIIVKLNGPDEVGEEAEKLGTDPLSDVALIKIRGDYRYETLRLGDSDSADVGEWVAAIGNPFDFGESFTLGVVSGLGRDDLGMLELEDYIQTDASINPGNSGGPLVNIKGEVIGINAVIYNRAVNIGFAVPINIAKNILTKLINGERIDRGMMGVSLSDLTPELSARLRIPGESGALVVTVRDGSPARVAGIRPGDVITAFNGKKVANYHEVKKASVSLLAGTMVRVGLVRDGKRMTVNVRLTRFERRA
ncbi:MAG: trypsin-like peptidase domain-containing protein [Nitrospinae bacterium]|nr:trypsin-like peptidase domain-containing protein [Nitrospinota bacterium]